jgi:hypothetical protein
MPTLFVQLARPSSTNPAGLAACGEYTEADGVVTLTKFNGEALRPELCKKYSRKLNAGDNARRVAWRLTKDYALSAHTNRFSARINYPPIKVA